ncbi:MAG: glycosyl hydrolase, partial [Hyphomonadaceae bacterium]
MSTTLRRRMRPFTAASLLLVAIASAAAAQRSTASAAAAPAASIDTLALSGLRTRMLGPFRGGRSTAVTGVPGAPNTYLMGTTGGGVWKSDDAGHTWANISDGYFGGSIGAIAVAPSDPNIV